MTKPVRGTVHLHGEIPRFGTVHYCKVPGCGKPLAKYNLTGKCFSGHNSTEDLNKIRLSSFVREITHAPIEADLLPEIICREVCSYFDIGLGVLRSNESTKPVTRARKVLTFLLVRVGKLTPSEVADRLKRDIGTIKITVQLAEDQFAEYDSDIRQLCVRLRSWKAP